MGQERMDFILLAMLLEMILYTALHKEMGLKYLKVSGASFLGMSAIKVEFKALGNFTTLINSSTTSSRPFFNKIKKCHKTQLFNCQDHNSCSSEIDKYQLLVPLKRLPSRNFHFSHDLPD